MLHSIRFLDTDVILTKLSLALLIFSKNIFLFPARITIDRVDASSVLQIQHTYAELTWRYLLHKYNLREAVRRFVQLVQCLSAVIQTMCHLQGAQVHTDDVESVAENAELQLILNDIEGLSDTDTVT